MADESPTPGTPAEEVGDAAATPTAGTPQSDGRNAVEGSNISKQEALAWKAKAERLNAAEAELAQLKAAQSPAAGREESGADPNARRQELLAMAKKAADAGDFAAELAYETALEREQDRRDYADYFQIQQLPEAERDEVAAHYMKNRHRLGDPKAARAEIRESKLALENEQLRQQLAASAKKPPGGPPTHQREVSAAELADRVTQRQWDRELPTLSPLQRLARQRQLNEGKVTLED